MTETTAPIAKALLFPTDFSSWSLAAFPVAERYAAGMGLRLLVLHVVRTGMRRSTPHELTDMPDSLRCHMSGIRPARLVIPFEHLAYGGAPGPTICCVAQRRKCELIVMGTRGSLGWPQLLWGSVTSYVVRNAPCPVTTVRQRPQTDESKAPDVCLALGTS
ncbi:MAG: universal stress protein [Planctomycetales bacterium]|nr:universal stress protein [Planctomycetales bacterium]